MNTYMDPSILVVTPTLGNRLSLKLTCESVVSVGADRVKHVLTCPETVVDRLRQEFPSSLICADNGSNGVYAAINHAVFQHSFDAEFICYINDDDYWLPGMSELIATALSSPNADIVYGRVNFVDERGKQLGKASSSKRYQDFSALFGRGVVMFTQQAVIFRKQLFSDLNGFDTRYRLAADNDFWIRAIKAGARCSFVDKECAAFCLQPGQLSADRGLSRRETEMLLKEHGIPSGGLASSLKLLRYRIENSNLYLERILKGRSHMRIEQLVGGTGGC